MRATPAVKEAIDSERNQGRAPDMGWLDHDRLGFNYRLSDLACALGLAQLERLDELLAGRARVAALYREALAGDRGARASVPGRGRRRAAAGSCSSSSSRAGSIATRPCVALRERGVDPSPTCRRSTCCRFYRERFGYRGGELPVCEDVAARSLALPFFPEMTEGQVARVAEALGATCSGSRADS